MAPLSSHTAVARLGFIMGGGFRAYTEIGHRIAALARNLRELAGVLGFSPQTVSKKLRGECAIFPSDLESFARHYKVSLHYFFDEPGYTPELAAGWQRIRRMPPEAHELVCFAAQLPEGDVRELLQIAKALVGSPD
jgi:transcriptional regulator with XRE-family HTH domain